MDPHQSFSLNIGWQKIGSDYSSDSGDSILLQHKRNASGFNFGIDYRFYLVKENKYEAPQGLYPGPYYNYNAFNNENDWNYTNSSVAPTTATTNTDLTIHTMGVEIGYQFVLWKLFKLDFLMVGPGLSNHKIDASITGNLTGAEKDKLREGLTSYITLKFPEMDYVLGDQKFPSTRSINTTAFEFRYLMSIGFNF